MYRGSRLAASFLLVITALATSAVALFVAPSAVAGPLGMWLAPAALVFAIGHWAALGGIARGLDWGRNLGVFVAEAGGGLAILAGVALLTGAHPFGAVTAAGGVAFAAWVGLVYGVLGIAAGRVPVLARLTPTERRRVGDAPAFVGSAA